MPEFEVVTPRPVRKLVDELVGKRAGYRTVHDQLRRDPCAEQLGAYRLSGPLAPIVEISEALIPFLATVMSGGDAWDADLTVRRAIEIRAGCRTPRS